MSELDSLTQHARPFTQTNAFRRLPRHVWESDLVSELRAGFSSRQFTVFAGDFPPFIHFRESDAAPHGPLVDLVDMLASTIGKIPTFQRLPRWQEVDRRMLSQEAVTVAAPIYLAQRVHTPVCAFCEIETFHYIHKVSPSKHRFAAQRGYVAAAEDKMARHVARGVKEYLQPSWRSEWDTLLRELRIAARRMAAQALLAVPADFVELEQLSDLLSVTCHRIAEPNIVNAIVKYVEDEYVVLLNRVTLAQVLKCLGSQEEYVASPLLSQPIIYPAGLPFHEDDAPLAQLFLNIITSGADEVESLIDTCSINVATSLPRNKRAILSPPGADLLAYFLRGGSLQSPYSNDPSVSLLAGSSARGTPSNRSISLPGLVCQFLAGHSAEMAEVRIGDGPDERRVFIELARLIAAGVDYIGARFQYVVTDNGATRVIQIHGDERQTRADLDATRAAADRIRSWSQSQEG